MCFELATQKCWFCSFFQTQSHKIDDIFAKQEGIVMLLVSFCSWIKCISRPANENWLAIKITELWLLEFWTVKSVEVVAAEVVAAVCTSSMGNSGNFGFLWIKSSHLCNHWGYRHSFGLNEQLNNSALFWILIKSLSFGLGLLYKTPTFMCELPIHALNSVVMTTKCPQKLKVD